MASPSKPPSAYWKGKAKATEDDFDDLNPVITYRHLHSLNLGVKDPLRVIALCDSDAFYAACEQVRLGVDPLEPLVVLQWDSLIAVNYPARKFGISRMDKVKEALRRCPHLKVVHVATYKEGDDEPGYWDNPDTHTHKVSLDYYRRESWKVYHMFKEGLPTGEIEKASIDEAFIDFTKPVRDEIIRRYPYLAEVPPDAPLGKDTPLPTPSSITWDELGTLIPINPPPPEEDNTEEENAPTDNGITPPTSKEVSAMEDIQPDSHVEETTWHDVALSIAAELMGKIRHDIHVKLGYTTSAGIARNKFLAKLTASYRKPNSQSILRNAAIPNYLKPLPFQKIRFLGGKLGEALAEEYDVKIVSDLLTVSLDEMQKKFGEESIWVWEILRGIDRTEVKEKPPITKSMLASKNLPSPIIKTSQGHHWIRVLAAELALRLKETRETIPALWPKSIVLHVRQDYSSSRSKQAPFPFIRDITVDAIAHAGDKLWKELVGTEQSRATPMKITNLSLSFSGIASMETGQRRIEGFFRSPPSPDTDDNAQSEWDRGNNDTIKPLSKRKRSGSDSRHGNDDNEEAGPSDAASVQAVDERYSYRCERCGQLVMLTDSVLSSVLGDGGEGLGDQSGVVENEIKEAISALRREHDDFHFAQDLANEPMHLEGSSKRAPIKVGDSTSGPTSKRKKMENKKRPAKDVKGNIATFFAKK